MDGYERALGDGTSLAAAKAAVLALMPADTTVTPIWVTHEGGSCALWNLKSATLGRWFDGKNVGDPHGAVGVVLLTHNSNDEPVFNPNNISDAIVSISPERKGTRC